MLLLVGELKACNQSIKNIHLGFIAYNIESKFLQELYLRLVW